MPEAEKEDIGASLRRTPLLGGLLRAWDVRLTPRGRYLLVVLGVLALVGLDTRRTQVYILFAAAAGLFLSAMAFAFRFRPRVQLDCPLPLRATAGTPLTAPRAPDSVRPRGRTNARLAHRAGRVGFAAGFAPPRVHEGGRRAAGSERRASSRSAAAAIDCGARAPDAPIRCAL